MKNAKIEIKFTRQQKHRNDQFIEELKQDLGPFMEIKWRELPESRDKGRRNIPQGIP